MDLKGIMDIVTNNLECTYLLAAVVTIIAVVMAWAFTKRSVLSANETRTVPASDENKEGQRAENDDLDTTHQAEGDEILLGSEEMEGMPDFRPEFGGGDATRDEIDPVEYSQHIPAHIKRAEQRVAIKKIEETMTEEQKQHERDVQQDQMAAIFKLMAENKDTFGVDSMGDVQSQMKLYM